MKNYLKNSLQKLPNSVIWAIAIFLLVVAALGFFGVKFTKPNIQYFLSPVALNEENRYAPVIVQEILKKNILYKQWSALYYPPNPPYEISLVMIEWPASAKKYPGTVYKEIKTNADWREISEKYGFEKKLLMP